MSISIVPRTQGVEELVHDWIAEAGEAPHHHVHHGVDDQDGYHADQGQEHRKTEEH